MKLVIIFGPPAVGKMTVGQALGAETGYLLFHNHVTIEPLLQFFPYDSPSFKRLNSLFREELFAELATTAAKGLIFTYVWALDDADDKAELDRFIARFGAGPADVCFVELYAALATRLDRNGTPNRLDHKRSKRDLARSAENLRYCDRAYVMRSGGAHPFPYPDRHLAIDNTQLAPAEVAGRIARHFGL